MDTNKIYCGDNLEIMKTFPDESMDLIYLDPPFFSGRNYEVIWEGEKRSFDDKINTFIDENKAEIEAYEERQKGGIETYQLWMRKRLIEMHRILKSTGSIYLHCDWHASHYLKIEMDKIFGIKNFKNEIIWKRYASGSIRNKGFNAITDTIFYYTKSNDFTFNHLYGDIQIDKFNKVEIETGKKFKLAPLIKSGNTNHILKFGNKTVELPNNKRFVWSQERVNSELKRNPLCFYWSSEGIPYQKLYLECAKGTHIDSLWLGIEGLRSNSSESFGWPTQKPEALLERIIKASSNKGDIVFDGFAGCGTSGAVALKLDRKFIGIDISPTGCKVMQKRLKEMKKPNGGTYDINIEIIGLPSTIEELKTMNPHEFQNWVCDKMLAKNTSHSKDKPSGSDGGRDGIIKANLPTGKYAGSPLEVKHYENIGIDVVRKLFAVMHDMKKKTGFIVAFSFGSGAEKQVAKYELEGSVKIKLIKAEELCDVEHYDFGGWMKAN